MEKTLVLLHADPEGAVPRMAREVLGLAQSLGAFDVAVLGPAALGPIGGCGAGRFFAADAPFPRSAGDAAAAQALIEAAGAELVLAPHTARFQRSLGLVAERLNAAIDTHVTELAPGGRAQRWYYRQRIEGAFTRTARPWFVLLESGCAAAYEGSSLPVSPIPVSFSAPARTEVLGVEAPPRDQQTIRPEARLLFVAGAGWTKKQQDGQPHIEEAGRLILEFVARAPCSLGSSKSLVDLSGEGQAVLPFLSHMHQVGQTGSTPRHHKGLSTCCHGEEPHVVGWRFVGERRAVNLDAACGWARGKADVLYVADAFEVMRELNDLMRA